MVIRLPSPVSLFSWRNEGDSSFINTTVVQSNQQRENCKILNGDLTKFIIEYERADQIPACMITCSGCTGSIRLEASEAMEVLKINNKHFKKILDKYPARSCTSILPLAVKSYVGILFGQKIHIDTKRKP
jgi:hypothetical protein